MRGVVAAGVSGRSGVFSMLSLIPKRTGGMPKIVAIARRRVMSTGTLLVRSMVSTHILVFGFFSPSASAYSSPNRIALMPRKILKYRTTSPACGYPSSPALNGPYSPCSPHIYCKDICYSSQKLWMVVLPAFSIPGMSFPCPIQTGEM